MKNETNFKHGMSFKTQHEKREQAIQHLKEAIGKLETPSKNANGGGIQLGGVYWRLISVLNEITPYLSADEGYRHAEILIKTHGVVANMEDLRPETRIEL